MLLLISLVVADKLLKSRLVSILVLLSRAKALLLLRRQEPRPANILMLLNGAKISTMQCQKAVSNLRKKHQRTLI